MKKTELTAFITFVFLSILGILHHELWLDEIQRWLLVRDSNSISELLINKRYEGHPSLWYFILYGLKHLTSQPMAMQLVHAALASTTAFLILRYAPFERWMKILFVFGYFPFFEYNIMSANYALVFMGLILFCVLYCQRNMHLLVFGLVLGLMANAHILGLIASFALFLFLLTTVLWDKNRPISQLLWMGAVYFALTSVAIWHSMPPSEHEIRAGFGSQLAEVGNWVNAFMAIERSYLPIPNFTKYELWNSYLIVEFIPKPVRLVIIVALIMGLIAILRKHPKALLLVGIASLGNFIFALFFPYNDARYMGFFFLFFMASYWLASHWSQRQEGSSPLPAMHRPFMYGLLSIHLIAAAITYAWDWRVPFSQAPQMVAYLHTLDASDDLILTDDYRISTTISGYLQKPVYYLAEERMGSFCNWTSKLRLENETDVKKAIAKVQAQFPERTIWLITNKAKLSPTLSIGDLDLSLMQSYTGSLYPTHDCYLYGE